MSTNFSDDIPRLNSWPGFFFNLHLLTQNYQALPIKPIYIPEKGHELKRLKKDSRRYDRWEPHHQKQKILVKTIEMITSHDHVYIWNFFIFCLNMYNPSYRVTKKKTCQLVIFQRNNTAKFTKICI